MNRLWRIMQYGYLVVGIVFFVEGVLKWPSDREGAFIMFGFGVFIILVFLLKRKFRRKIEERNKNN